LCFIFSLLLKCPDINGLWLAQRRESGREARRTMLGTSRQFDPWVGPRVYLQRVSMSTAEEHPRREGQKGQPIGRRPWASAKRSGARRPWIRHDLI